MAFTKLLKRPDPASLLTVEGLQRLSNDQFNEHVKYWQGVRGLGGFLQMELATTMLRHVMQTVDLVRIAGKLPPDEQREHARDIAVLAPYALGGLAMSQLLQTSYGRDVAEGNLGVRPGALGIDMKSVAGKINIFMVHQPISSIHGTLPYDGEQTGRYEDETLVVRTVAPAFPTTDFSERFKALSGGVSFVPEDYITLRPQLKASYVPPAS